MFTVARLRKIYDSLQANVFYSLWKVRFEIFIRLEQKYAEQLEQVCFAAGDFDMVSRDGAEIFVRPKAV